MAYPCLRVLYTMSAHECKYLYATWVQLFAQNEETGKWINFTVICDLCHRSNSKINVSFRIMQQIL